MKGAYVNINQDVIDRCKKGEREAQFRLYKLYYKTMYNTSLRIVGNEYDAEDIMQESFMKAFRKIGSYEGKVSLGAWLKKIVINSSLDLLKKRKMIFEQIDEAIPCEEEVQIFMENAETDLQKIRKALDGHFERFEQKLLQKEPHKRKQIRIKYFFRAAAAILFVALVVNQVLIYFARHEAKPVNLSSVSNEYKEVEFYYTSAIDHGMEQWERLTKTGLIPPGEQQMMLAQMKEFDETYARLQNELRATPDDERVINAMLEVYQAKLSIITMIINKLETIKKQKHIDYETKI